VSRVGRGSPGALNGASNLNAGADVELLEHVVHVRLDSLWAQKERGGDLRIRPTIDHEPRNLKLALSQRFNTDPIGLTRPRAPVDALAEASQFMLGSVAIPQRTAGVELRGGALQLGHRSFGPAGLGQCVARQRSRQSGLDRNADIVGSRCRGERPLSGEVRIARVKRDGRRCAICL
jgi:hypothetical protein